MGDGETHIREGSQGLAEKGGEEGTTEESGEQSHNTGTWNVVWDDEGRRRIFTEHWACVDFSGLCFSRKSHIHPDLHTYPYRISAKCHLGSLHSLCICGYFLCSFLHLLDRGLTVSLDWIIGNSWFLGQKQLGVSSFIHFKPSVIYQAFYTCYLTQCPKCDVRPTNYHHFADEAQEAQRG